MKTRTKRLIFWALCICISLILGYINNEYYKEKAKVMVYAPEDMKKAFSAALKEAGLSSNYRIVITTEKEKADICVDYSKENDESYTKFAFSPFVVSYNTEENHIKDLKEAGVLIESEYYTSEKYYDIDFKKVVDEVIEEGKWENLGVDDKKLTTIKIFYPAESTIYWDDFYDFMLVTVNNGNYPETLEELENAEEYVERFFKSSFTEPVTDFEEQVVRTNGFPESSFYVFPEKLGFDVSSDTGNYTRFFYPTTTVNFNYYLRATTDLGKKVVNSIEDSDFYKKLNNKKYRSKLETSIDVGLFDNVYDSRDAYRVIEVVELKKETESE